MTAPTVTGWAILGMHGLSWQDLFALWTHFLMLSMLAVGGAITTAPDMQRWLVGDRGWLSDAQFAGSIAVAQAAPGPNILFVALLGWNVAGLAGLMATMSGIMLPSSVVAVHVSRYGRRRGDAIWMRAFTAGLTPLTLGLLLATGWVLADGAGGGLGVWLLAASATVMAWRTKVAPVWLIAGGGLAGLLGWA